MKYVLGTIALVVAIVAAAVVVLGHVPLVADDQAEVKDGCRQVITEPVADQPIWPVVIGDNESDLANREVHLRHLEEVVLPAAARSGARVVVGTISALSASSPTVVADLSMRATGEAADNPENQADAVEFATKQILACTEDALDAAAGSGKDPATDVFGAVEWAGSLLPPGSSGSQLTILSDGINTSRKACDFNQQRIGPEHWDVLFQTCAPEPVPGLAGATVWLGGLGLDDGDPETKQPAVADLKALWTEFFSRQGAVVTKAGPVILPGS